MWQRKPEYPEKTTDLPQVKGKLYHIMLYRLHLTWAGFELPTLVVLGTDYIGRYKSNYHTITNTTAPRLILCMVVYTNYYKKIHEPMSSIQLET
jgi:hypothetical protein